MRTITKKWRTNIIFLKGSSSYNLFCRFYPNFPLILLAYFIMQHFNPYQKKKKRIWPLLDTILRLEHNPKIVHFSSAEPFFIIPKDSVNLAAEENLKALLKAVRPTRKTFIVERYRSGLSGEVYTGTLDRLGPSY